MKKWKFGKNENLGNNENFEKKWKFWEKNENFGKKIKILEKINVLWKKWKFWKKTLKF